MALVAGKEPLLLLVHRIPFPPNKGDKIRSYHLLKSLSERYSVRLGFFVDDADDWQHVETLREWASEVKALPLQPRRAKLKSLRALASGEALSLPYYRNRALQKWVDKQCKSGCSKAVVFSSTMAQYLLGKPQLTVVADFVDVDSDKWAQYAKSLRPPMSWVYQREARQLFRFERQAAAGFAATAFVTGAETALFKKLAPEISKQLITVANGVDYHYFAEDKNCPSPYEDSDEVIVFTGAMDYWANIDAVVWFATTIWPKIRLQCPNAKFYIVGGNPSPAVVKLAAIEGITVTGRVPDVRPYVQYSDVAVAPLRIARGVQNKVLEALSMEKPVVMSPQAAEGLEHGYEGIPGVNIIDTDNNKHWVSQVAKQLAAPTTSAARREYVKQHYDWERNLRVLSEALEPRHSDSRRIIA